MELTYFVIGAGSIGRRHHENLKTLDRDVRLIPWREFVPAEFEDLLRGRAKQTAVVIATSTGIRLELVSLCAGFGVPMYIEKPLSHSPEELIEIYKIPEEVQRKSVVGFMMRYHPVVDYIVANKPAKLFRSTLTIGHDVNQWRQNWRFSQSYASDPDGGGVLLDLCHEIDIACLLAPDLRVSGVSSLVHPSFPNVDITSTITANSGDLGLGSINLDYLAPKLVRRGLLEGISESLEYNLEENSIRLSNHKETVGKQFIVDRNHLFVGLMKDFITLAESGGEPGNPLCPRLDLVRNSCSVIADAWAKRQFVGQLEAELR